MMYFYGYDVEGNECRVDEYPGGKGVVKIKGLEYNAVRLDPSVYMTTDGKVFASTIQNCTAYDTEKWHNWARKKMLNLGFSPIF